MKLHRRLIIAVVPLILSLVFVPVAGAHPLGNFTINHYAGLQVRRETIAIDYVLDMAEIPAFQEIDGLDANRNGQPDPDEFVAYPAAKCGEIQNDLALSVGGQPVALTLGSSGVEFPAGAGGLLTLRLTCAISAAIPMMNEARQIDFADNAYAERMGWREIVVSGEGVALEGNLSDYTESLSKRLTEYPQNRINSPLNQRDVTFNVAGGQVVTQGTESTTAQLANAPAMQRSDAFTELITLETLNLPTILFALGMAFVWGAMHGMTPGHGKTIVGAYLVGSRGTAKHAFYLGLTTTVTHTLGVFALGLVTLLASQFIFPEQVFPWISFLSGILVVGIGLNLCVSRLREARQAALGRQRQAVLLADGYHEHNGVAHSHDGGQEHSHLPPGGKDAPVTWRSLLALGISGGLLPCPSALVVLLSAIALGRVGFGLVLVLAFSLGLAAVLTGIGLSLVYAGRLFKRIPSENWLIRLVPAASAAFIMVAGLGITAEALMQLGWIRV